MTPNLVSARKAIQAELSYAKQGIEYYSARVDALETALNQLEIVDTDQETSTETRKRKTSVSKEKKAGTGKRGRPRAAQSNGHGQAKSEASPSKGRRGRKAGTSSRGDTGLPTTGAEFWLKLITDEPQSAVEIANAAAATVGLKGDQKVQIQKLKQRVAPALAALVAARKIQDSGAGRERRFFKSGQASA